MSFGKNHTTRSVSGRRKDLGNRFFRSKMEANVARMLQYLGLKYEYESETFDFKAIRKGTTQYKPDFKIAGTKKADAPLRGRLVEVKGYLDPQSKTKMKRFKKYFPEEFSKLICVVQGRKSAAYLWLSELGVKDFWFYSEIVKQFKTLPGWE